MLGRALAGGPYVLKSYATLLRIYGFEGNAFPCGRAEVSADPFCGGRSPRNAPRGRVRTGFAVTG